MKTRTPEQIEADEALTAAIEANLRVYEMLEDDERTTTFAVVGMTASMDMLDRGAHGVFCLFKDGSVSDPEALGLFTFGADRIRRAGWTGE